MRAINLKTNHLTAPLGMDAGPLFLSWHINGRGKTGVHHQAAGLCFAQAAGAHSCFMRSEGRLFRLSS